MNDIISLFITRWDWFLELTWQHLYLSAIAVFIAAVCGLALAIFISEKQAYAGAVLGFCNLVYTIPSISLLGFLLPLSGIGNTTAVIALTVYALLPMIRNTYTGIHEIDKDIIEAAKAMGCTNAQLIFKIKLPLALPMILAGFRNMIVMTIALAGICSYIGAGGLGLAIYRGITTNNTAMTVAGSLLIAATAFTSDIIIGRWEHHIKRKRRMIQ
ncbi:MAG: ABC transporter permease [Firmicutes bacterium]|nr:ABC transporter permease [Bacillota bacterium]